MISETKTPSSKVFLLFVFVFFQPLLFSASLDLKSYINKVKLNHKGYLASLVKIDSVNLKNHNAELLYAPSIFSKTEHKENQSNHNSIGKKGQSQSNTHQSIGISKKSSTGLESKIYYQLEKGKKYASSVNLELNQPLLNNAIKIQEKIIKEQNNTVKFAEEFKALQILSDSECKYWNLVFLQKIIQVQLESASRAKLIYQYHVRQRRKNLAEESDVLQARAAFDLRKLELASFQERLNLAELEFNAAIGIKGYATKYTLNMVKFVDLLLQKIPKRNNYRLDTLSLKKLQNLIIHKADMSLIKNKPNLNLFGGISVNGNNENISKAINSSCTARNPNTFIGLKFTMPFALQSIKKSNLGYVKKKRSARLNYQRQLFEQEQLWNNLVKQFNNHKQKLSIADHLEKSQKNKLDNEIKMQKNGRSTTYKILLFEQDYLNSRTMKLNIMLEILIIHAKLKTFGNMNECY